MPPAYDPAAMVAELDDHFRRLVRPSEPLSRHSTFGVGGRCDAWVTVEREAVLAELVELAIDREWPLMLVGNGALLVLAAAVATGRAGLL